MREFELQLRKRSTKELQQLTQATKDTIATAEEYRKTLQSHGCESKDLSSDESRNKEYVMVESMVAHCWL